MLLRTVVVAFLGLLTAAVPINSRADNGSPGTAVTLRVMTFNVWYGGEQVSLAKVGEAIRAAVSATGGSVSDPLN